MRSNNTVFLYENRDKSLKIKQDDAVIASLVTVIRGQKDKRELLTTYRLIRVNIHRLLINKVKVINSGYFTHNSELDLALTTWRFLS